MNWLGVDPGYEGAAVLLEDDGLTAARAWYWKRRANKAKTYWLRRLVEGELLEKVELESIHRVAMTIATDVYDKGARQDWHVTLCVEGLYVPDDRAPAGFIPLAEGTGELIGPLRALALGEILRPVAGEWRAKVLKLPRFTRSKVADARAAQAVRMRAKGLYPLQEVGHICDAWCIARYAWGMTRTPEL